MELQCEGEQGAGEWGGWFPEFVDAMSVWRVAGDDYLRRNQDAKLPPQRSERKMRCLGKFLKAALRVGGEGLQDADADMVGKGVDRGEQGLLPVQFAGSREESRQDHLEFVHGRCLFGFAGADDIPSRAFDRKEPRLGQLLEVLAGGGLFETDEFARLDDVQFTVGRCGDFPQQRQSDLVVENPTDFPELHTSPFRRRSISHLPLENHSLQTMVFTCAAHLRREAGYGIIRGAFGD